MKLNGSIALFQYWNRLRDGRPAPKRSEVEPADIKSLLADTFILGAATGQQLNAWVESDTSEVTVAAFDPNGEILRTAAFDVYVEQLSSSGDYELEVWNQSSIVSAYTLTVYIT